MQWCNTVLARPIWRGVWGVTAGPKAVRPQKAACPAVIVTIRTAKWHGCPAGPPSERFLGVTGRKIWPGAAGPAMTRDNCQNAGRWGSL